MCKWQSNLVIVVVVVCAYKYLCLALYYFISKCAILKSNTNFQLKWANK